MARRPRIKIELVDRKGPCPCHHGHKVGDAWDFDTERGGLCPMAAHVAFPYVDILRYGGSIPGQPAGQATFCCPDADTINVFRATIQEPEGAHGDKGPAAEKDQPSR